MTEDVNWAEMADPGDYFVGHIGLVIDEATSGRVTGHLDIAPHHHQPYGIVHGGVYCSIIETLASYGAAVTAHERTGNANVVGVSNATDFIRAHREGRLNAVAEPVHAGRTQHIWQVVITRDSDGKVVARGQVRLVSIQPESIGG